MRLSRFLTVGVLCALLNNLLMIVFAAWGCNYLTATFLAFVPVLIVGFVLHTRVTFQTPASVASFCRYTVSMATNYPAWLLCLYLFCDLGGIAVKFAAPATTVLMFAWNFLIARWALKAAKPAALVRRPIRG
jgi:putative flippase GtrA